MNLPNQLTVARLVMAFIFMALMSLPHPSLHIIGYIVFIAAALTDLLDGRIARARNLITNFGKLMDPVADKVLVVAAFIMLMEMPYVRVPGWTVVLILAREFLVTGVRGLAASDGTVIAANQWGKTKTFFQMGYAFWFIPLGIAAQMMDDRSGFAARHAETLHIFKGLLYAESHGLAIFVALYTVYSGIQFVRVNWHLLRIDQM